MDIARTRQLAGLTPHTPEVFPFDQLDEVVQLPNDVSMDDLIKRLDACKRALSIVNRMTDPADKKKWLSATFVNLNKVTAAVKRMAATGQRPGAAQLDRTPITNPGGATGDGRFMIGDDRI